MNFHCLPASAPVHALTSKHLVHHQQALLPCPISHPLHTFPCPCSVAASFGAGVLYSLSSGAKFDLGGAFATGLTFAAFNGLIYQVGGIG